MAPPTGSLRQLYNDRNDFVLKGKVELKHLSSLYPIKIVEIVNTVFSPMYPVSE